ncbi:hypothetical protein ACOCJ5_11005 [Knoellia sp. CPCC 206450]|uniref:hypothetical protein n=1 Tax=Knoellia tibetensis TaxID=3404798 RepID=UPI003B435D62
MTVVSEAAADRARTAAERLVELRRRMRALEEGRPSTEEDVRQARRRALVQMRAVEEARRRLMLTTQAAATRRAQRAEQLRLARQQSVRLNDDVRSVTHQQADSSLCAAGQPPADDGAAAPSTELIRLRQGMTALIVWDGESSPYRLERRQVWAERVVATSRAADWKGWLTAVCEVAVEGLAGVRGAAITVRTGQTPELTASSDPWAESVQDLELVLGEGPSADAQRRGRTVLVPRDSHDDDRWIAYASAAEPMGVAGTLAVTLWSASTCVGTLTFYGHADVEDWQPRHDDAASLAEIASAVLMADVETVRLGARAPSQSVHVAVGILSTQLAISLDEASALLRAHAFAIGVPLTQLAREVTTGQSDLGSSDPTS